MYATHQHFGVLQCGHHTTTKHINVGFSRFGSKEPRDHLVDIFFPSVFAGVPRAPSGFVARPYIYMYIHMHMFVCIYKCTGARTLSYIKVRQETTHKRR